MTNEIDALTARLVAFRDARDWKKFHGLKNLIVALNLEAGELLELCHWKGDQEMESGLDDPDLRRELAGECADVFIYLLLLCEKAGIDPVAAAQEKIALNETRYPVEKSRGRALKYNDL